MSSNSACCGHCTTARALYQQIEEDVNTETQLALSQMCGIAGVSRAGYYRLLEPAKPDPQDLKLRDAMRTG